MVHRVYNLLFSIISFAIHKSWIKDIDTLIEQNKTEQQQSLVQAINKDLYMWNNIINKSTFDKDHCVFRKIWCKLDILKWRISN